MKNTITLLLVLFSLASYCQEKDTLHTQIFTLTPVSKHVDKVNGMAFGIGHQWSATQKRTINGFNLEVNPVTPLILLMADPSKAVNDSLTLRLNGLHLSAGGLWGGVKHNGLGISIFNVTHTSNGVSLSGFYNVSKQLNGLYIAGFANSTDKANGLLVAAVNSADIFNGLQIGLYNKSQTMTGVQIGLFNKSGRTRGLQIGLWNMNAKRSLPFINW